MPDIWSLKSSQICCFFFPKLRLGLFIQVLFLSKVRHQNLVQLKGYCLEFKKQFLVFEFMSGGSLKDHLYGKRPGTDTEFKDYKGLQSLLQTKWKLSISASDVKN